MKKELKFFRNSILIYLFLLSSCGYHFQNQLGDGNRVTLSVPYIEGDLEGQLTNALVLALSSSGNFKYVHNKGQFILKGAIRGQTNEKIGYRYDRKPTTGKLRKNLLGTENRKTCRVEFVIINSSTGEEVMGPFSVTSYADYDYVDPSSIKDLTFVKPSGKREQVINFSLGQLDSIEGAQDDAASPLYRKLAQKIVDVILNQKW